MDRPPILSLLAGSASDLAVETADRLGRVETLDPDTTHEFRVATKRLRSYWLLVAPILSEGEAKAYGRDLRDAARPLAGERDDFVRDKLLNDLTARADNKDGRAIAFIRDELFGESGTGARTRPSGFDVDRGISTLMADAERWLGQRPRIGNEDQDTILTGFASTYSEGWSRGQKALVVDTPQGYHSWRRWVKYSYYQYKWFRSAFPGLSEVTEGSLKRLGSLLGKLHDAHHLLQELEERSISTSSPKAFRCTREYVLSRERRLKRKVRKASRRLLAIEPALVVHEVREAVREHCAHPYTENLEFIPLADHEGDGAAAATRAADLH